MDALQYYGAQGSGDSVIYGGMQDNGSAKVFTTPTTVPDDQGNPIKVSSVQVFGGDGGYTLVDPANSNNVITEYTGLTALKSTDGGANWHFIAPADPDPRFIAPINMDRTNPSHLVAGGAFVWNSEAGVAGTTAGTGASTDWQPIFDVRKALGGNATSQVTALDAVTIGGTQYVAAAWCGPCNAELPGRGRLPSGHRDAQQQRRQLARNGSGVHRRRGVRVLGASEPLHQRRQDRHGEPEPRLPVAVRLFAQVDDRPRRSGRWPRVRNLDRRHQLDGHLG